MTLAHACTGQYFQRHPAPDTQRWRAIPDPDQRLRTALGETYAYHRDTEAMMTRVLADGRDHELLAPYHAYWRHAAEVIVDAFPVRGTRRTLLSAAIALALSFDTWRTLVREQELTGDQAIDVALRLASNTSPTRTDPDDACRPPAPQKHP